MTIQLLHGDCRELLDTLPAESVQCIVTSPPYFGLRKYTDDAREIGGEATPAAYVAALVDVFMRCWRVLRADGVLWLNLGDSYTGYHGNKRVPDDQAPSNKPGYIENMRKSTANMPGYKPKDLMGLPWRVAFALQDAGWFLRCDIIWSKPNCLSGGTMLYARTQKGEGPAMLKDLTRLRPDTVQLWNGERWTQVLAWTENPRPENPLELTLRNGQRIGCTPDHLWPTHRGNVRADELLIGDVIQTCTLPEPAKPCDPRLVPGSVGWFVGLYIAEGSMSKGCIQISSHTKEHERYELLCDLAEQYGGTCRKHQTSDNGMTINIYSPMLRAILEMYVSGNDASDKHLTPAAWRRDNRFLEMVLRGYLAGDGHYDAKNDRYRLGFTRNYNLESDLRTLCARLGYSLRLNLSTANIGEQLYPAFRGELRMVRSEHRNNKQDGEIVGITGSKARKFWDVTVADDPHLFSLASGVLTHNCMPESVTDRPTRAHEYLFLFAKGPRYFYDAAAIAEPATNGEKFHGAYDKPGMDTRTKGRNGRGDENNQTTTRNKRSVWHIPTQPLADAHYAPMPEALVTPCILAGSSAQACETCGAPWRRVVEREASMVNLEEGARQQVRSAGAQTGGTQKVTLGVTEHVKRTDRGLTPSCACTTNTGSARSVVLDPFIGSGTVARVCERLQRSCIGIDLAYQELQEKRTDKVQIEMFV